MHNLKTMVLEDGERGLLYQSFYAQTSHFMLLMYATSEMKYTRYLYIVFSTLVIHLQSPSDT